MTKLVVLKDVVGDHSDAWRQDMLVSRIALIRRWEVVGVKQNIESKTTSGCLVQYYPPYLVPLLFNADDGGICVRVRGTNPKRNAANESAPVLEMRMRCVRVSEHGGKCEVW
jgi:hypothetical protein